MAKKRISQLLPAPAFDPTMLFEVETADGHSRYITGQMIVDYIGAHQSALITVDSLKPTLGITQTATLTREVNIADVAEALGFTLGVELFTSDTVEPSNHVLGLSMALAVALEQQFTVEPALGVTMASVLTLDDLNLALEATSHALGISQSTLLTSIVNPISEHGLGVSASAIILTPIVNPASSHSLGISEAAALDLVVSPSASEGLGISEAAALTRIVNPGSSHGLGISQASILTTASTGPAFVNKGAGNDATGSSMSAPLPTGRVVGNLMLMVLHTTSSVTVATPTGWTGGMNASGRTICFWRIIDGTESTNPTVSWTGGSTTAHVQIFQYVTPNPSSPWGGNKVNSGTGTSVATGNITTTTAACLIIDIITAEGVAIPDPSGWPHDEQTLSTISFNIGHQTGPTPAQLTGGASTTLASSAVWTAYLYELKS